MKYMLDTNICIYLMKHQPPSVARRFAACRQGDDALDKLIASQAKSLNLTLVTNNLDDFRVYPDIVLENWVEEN